MKILVIEDHEDTAKLIKKVLKKEGYAVDYLTTGAAGQRRIELNADDYDLVILDLMLPDKSGLDICKEVRAQNISVPILVLTAKKEREEKVMLLNSGADDYLVKPFEFEELSARIRAITRRPKKTLPTELKISDLILNPATRKVTRDGHEIDLTLKEFRILEYLMTHSNQAIGREDIISNVWDFEFDSFSNVLDVFINKLRNKVDRGYPRKLIQTVRGIGYKLRD